MTTSVPINAVVQQDEAREALKHAVASLNTLILGKPEQIKLALTCVLSGGHLLIEDVPGVGKTTMARALAQVLGLDFARIQFTSDLLPADVTGISVYQKDSGNFQFLKGPVFTQMLLADEINRATPKAQSALLEAMQERQVTVDGTAYGLPQPFFVVATQNPADQIGTFELPESQLDRFLMRISLGYPEPEFERQLLEGNHKAMQLSLVPASLSDIAVVTLRDMASRVKVSDALLNYLQALISFTRTSPLLATGLSPRAAIALASAARAYALIDGRQAVYPEDLQCVFPSVAAHRLIAANGQQINFDDLAQSILNSVAIP